MLGMAEQKQAQRLIRVHGKEESDRAAVTLRKAFADNPFHRWQIGVDDLTTPANIKKSLVVFKFQTKILTIGGSQINEIDDFASVAMWLSPKGKVPEGLGILRAPVSSVIRHTGLTYVKRMTQEYLPQIEKARKKYLKDRKYYVLELLGTDPDQQGRGLASELLRKYHPISDTENSPLWLEAGSAQARDLYKRLGFEVMEELRFSVGKVGDDGRKQKGGPGVPVWLMIRWPASS